MRHVNLPAVQQILTLTNKEDPNVANVAAELVKISSYTYILHNKTFIFIFYIKFTIVSGT